MYLKGLENISRGVGGMGTSSYFAWLLNLPALTGVKEGAGSRTLLPPSLLAGRVMARVPDPPWPRCATGRLPDLKSGSDWCTVDLAANPL